MLFSVLPILGMIIILSFLMIDAIWEGDNIMKPRSIIVLGIITVSICCSCSPKSPSDFDQTGDALTETSTLFEPNPFEKNEDVSLELETENAESKTASEVQEWFQYVNEQLEEDRVVDVGVDFEGGQTHYTYDGEPVRIPYMYRMVGGKNSDSVGLIVLCNGFPVNSWMEGESEQDGRLFHIADVHCDPDDPEDYTTIPLYFVPEGKKGDLVKVQIYDYYDANYDPDQTERELLTYYVVFGTKYLTRCVGMVNIDMEQDGLSTEHEVFEEYTREDLPYNLLSKARDSLSFYSESKCYGNKGWGYLGVKQGEILDLDLRYYGVDCKEQITAVYVDGELYPAFDGKYFSKCDIVPEEFTCIQGQIDTSDLSIGRHFIFSSLGYQDMMNSPAFSTFLLEVMENDPEEPESVTDIQ